jgi:hypothetical protein
MWAMMAAELAATGALLMFWFQGLSAGKSCWPSNVGTTRSSSASRFKFVPRRGLRGRLRQSLPSSRFNRQVAVPARRSKRDSPNIVDFLS